MDLEPGDEVGRDDLGGKAPGVLRGSLTSTVRLTTEPTPLGPDEVEVGAENQAAARRG